MEINAETLYQSPQILQEFVTTLQRELSDTQAKLKTYEKRCEQYAQAYDLLQHQVKELLRHRFGKKSERFIDDAQSQLNLFANLLKPSITAESTENLENDDTHVKRHARRKKHDAERDVVHRIEIIPISDADKQCGSWKTVIRYETKMSMHHQHEVFEVVEQRREVVVCPNGCDGAIVTAPAPLHVLPK